MPDAVLRALLALAALLYLSSFVFLLKKVAAKVKRAPLLSNIFYLAAVVLNAGLIVYNYAVNLAASGANYMPFVSVYQLLVFIAFIFFPARIFLEKGCGFAAAGAYCSIGAAAVTAAVCFFPVNAVWEFRPALRSPFFVPHIMCYVLAYALSFVALLVTLHGIVKKKNMSDVSALCVRILFPFLTCGLFMGAIWADQIWGDFWSWDLKESWSLVTWLTYMIALHLYRRPKLKRFANALVILGFVFVLMTFFFAKVFPNAASVHAYN